MRKLLLLIVITTTLNIHSNDSFIAGVFSTPLSTYFDMDMEANNNEFDMEEQFVKDISEAISGMIYGWKFSYIPSDIKRNISEIFNIEPVAQLIWGDPNLRFKDNWVKDYIMYQNVTYYLQEFQKKRIKSWNSSVTPTSYGEGSESIYIKNGKSLALKEALKDSIKREFQSRGKDKPRSIQGQILLREIPRIFVNSGVYNTQIEVLLIYKDINEYKYH